MPTPISRPGNTPGNTIVPPLPRRSGPVHTPASGSTLVSSSGHRHLRSLSSIQPDRRFVFGASNIRRRAHGPPGSAGQDPDITSLLPDVLPHRYPAAHDIAALTRRIDTLANRPDVRVEELGRIGGYPIQAVHLQPTDSSRPPRMRVLITGGIHGNEPCGTGAAMMLLEQLLANPLLRRDVAFTVIPAVNPRGLVANTRRSPDDRDLNRHFGDHDDVPPEVGIVRRVFDATRPDSPPAPWFGWHDDASEAQYDLALDLHSGNRDRNGFWVLHRNSAALLRPVLDRFEDHWPVLHGNSRPYTLERPGLGTSTNRNTFKDYAVSKGVPFAVTVEAPGFLSYRDQVVGENELVRQILVEARHQLGVASAIAA